MALIDFIHKIGKLKRIKRKGWIHRGLENVESIADHTFRVALIAAIVSDKIGLNTQKVIKMALIHDLPEIYIGDITPFDEPSIEKEKLEAHIAKDLFDDLGEQKEEYTALLKEYIERKTIEAKLVYQIDKLEFITQGIEYEIERKVNIGELPFAEEVLHRPIHKIIEELYYEIITKRKKQ